MRVTIEHDDGKTDIFDLTVKRGYDDDNEIDVQPVKRSEKPNVQCFLCDEPEEGPDDDEVGQPEPSVEGEELNPQCFLCDNFIEDTNSLYCFGCRTFICPDHPQTPWGTHMPDDHDKP